MRSTGDHELISGRYLVQSGLGRGGMGAVYRVLDTSTGVQIALKRLLQATSSRHVALFEREYHTLAGLKHPRVVEVFEYGSDASGPYYTMELLDGQDLSTLAPLPWRQVCGILRDIASVLTLLHARRLVHRDVNPCNIWRTPDGSIKLIDFGALAPFGQVDHIAGSPPLIPPEALHGQLLDQRSDLYSLGAVGYWLLTGLNAYPARAISQLKEAWNQKVRPASVWIRQLERPDLEVPPAELDELLSSLLNRDPMLRPASATEVIHRLSTLAGLPASTPVVDAHLRSAAFVSRERELGQLEAALDAAREGRGCALLISSERGLGRSRLLGEFGLRAGLQGATVLQVSADLQQGIGATGHAFALRLLDVAPEVARATVGPYAAVLGHFSADFRERLEISKRQLAAMPKTPGEARMRVHAALADWFLDTARNHPLVLLVDDLHRADEASLAWLARLARSASQRRLLLVGAVSAGGSVELEKQPAGRALQRDAQRISLPPLEQPELLELLRSVFGDAAHLERLCGRLHRLSGGNPADALQLAEHLVRKGTITYAELAWVLPRDLEASALPDNPATALVARLDVLSATARAVARKLSVASRSMPLDGCAALLEEPSAQLFAALEELVRENVLVCTAERYHFAHESLRTTLLAELAPELRARIHGRLAAIMLAAPVCPPLVRLEAAVHGLLGQPHGSAARSRFGAVAIEASMEVAVNRQSDLGAAVPALETALEIFRREQRPGHEQIALVSALAMASYYSERKLADRYGDDALGLLQEVLYLPLARRLRTHLGARLALYVALACAVAGFALRLSNPRVPSLRQAVLLLFNVVATLTGTATVCLATTRAAGYSEVVEPLCALGTDHAAVHTFKMSRNVANTISDRLSATRRDWEGFLQRLEDPKPIRALPADARSHFHAAALYAYGIIECYRDGPGALEIAERLERFGMKLYDMSADQLRTLYYLQQGKVELSDHYRQRVEMHAIARGSSWQVEGWLPGPMLTFCLRTHDAATMRVQVKQLERLVIDSPWLQTYLTRSTGVYLLLCGRYRAALPYLEQCLEEEPQELVGWARSLGALARAHNALGDHVRAKQVCEQALARLTPADLEFCAINLIVLMELARAEAGLGDVTGAAERIDVLLAHHTPNGGPLTLGSLHELRADLALLAEDPALAEQHHAQMERWYRCTDVPSLLRRCERQKAGQGSLVGLVANDVEEQPHVITEHETALLHRLMHGGGGDEQSVCSWMLSQLADAAKLREAYLFLLRDGELEQVASIARKPAPSEIVCWASEWLTSSGAVTRTTIVMEPRDLSAAAPEFRTADHLKLGDLEFQLHLLRSEGGDTSKVVGVLVTDRSYLTRDVLSPALLRAAARRLRSTMVTASSSSAEGLPRSHTSA